MKMYDRMIFCAVCCEPIRLLSHLNPMFTFIYTECVVLNILNEKSNHTECTEVISL